MAQNIIKMKIIFSRLPIFNVCCLFGCRFLTSHAIFATKTRALIRGLYRFSSTQRVCCVMIGAQVATFYDLSAVSQADMIVYSSIRLYLYFVVCVFFLFPFLLLLLFHFDFNIDKFSVLLFRCGAYRIVISFFNLCMEIHHVVLFLFVSHIFLSYCR